MPLHSFALSCSCYYRTASFSGKATRWRLARLMTTYDIMAVLHLEKRLAE